MLPPSTDARPGVPMVAQNQADTDTENTKPQVTPATTPKPTVTKEANAPEGDGDSSIIAHVPESVSKVVEKAVKTVDDAVGWVEEKVNKLSVEKDEQGPYTSPATCVPSDLDPIASGILPAMTTQEVEMNGKNEKQTDEHPTQSEQEKGTKAAKGDGKV